MSFTYTWKYFSKTDKKETEKTEETAVLPATEPAFPPESEEDRKMRENIAMKAIDELAAILN
jgi:hypothetical protein